MDQNIPCTAKLVLEFPGEREATRVARSLEPDNEGFVATRLSGRKIIARFEARSIDAMLHTLDDYLACLGVAEGLRGPGKKA